MKKNQNLPSNFKPVWNEVAQSFDFVDTGEKVLTRKDHHTYDSIIEHFEAKERAKAEEAKALTGAKWVCDVPVNARVFVRPGQIIVVEPGAAPVVYQI
jgi:hypothetical protein